MFKKSMIILISAAVLTVSSCGGDESKVKMPETLNIQGDTLSLNGEAFREVPFLIFDLKVYKAGMYLKSKSSDVMEITNSDDPIAFKCIYVLDVTFDRVEPVIEAGFQKACSKLEINRESIESDINRYKEVYKKGISKRDVLVFAYNKAHGLQIFKNNDTEALATISNKDFAKMFRGSWLLEGKDDEKTKLMRKSLLGL